MNYYKRHIGDCAKKARIGIEALEALEADQESRDWTIDDLKAQRKIKELAGE